MKISNLWNWAKREHPSKEFNHALYGLTSRHNSYTGKDINEENAMESSAFFNGVRILSETVASLPLHLYQRIATGGKKRANEQPEYDLLHMTPNPEMTSMGYRESQMVNLCTWGNFYAEKVLDGTGRVVELWPLLSRNMDVKRINGELVYPYALPSGEPHIFTRRTLLHVTGFSPNGLQGFNIVKKSSEAIALGLALEEYASRFFGNGAMPSAVIEYPESLSEPAIKRLRDAWEDRHKGLDKSHRVAILEEGAKLHEYGIKPDEAQAIEARKFQIEEVARILNIPVHLLKNLDRSTNNNIEQQSLEFVIYSLRPWLVRVEQTYNTQILNAKQRKKYFYEHLVDGLLRGDTKTRHEAYASGRQWGYLSANDVREMENKNPIEGGDVYYMPFNMADITKMDGLLEKQNPDNTTDDTPDDTDEENKSVAAFEIRAAISSARIKGAYTPLIKSAGQMIVNREIKAIRAELKKQFGERGVSGFTTWLEEFYAQHGGYVREKLTPVLQSYHEMVAAEANTLIGDVVGSGEMEKFFNDTIEATVKRYVSGQSGQLTSIVKEMPVEDVMEAVSVRLDEWFVRRADKLAMDETARHLNSVARQTWLQGGVKKLKWRAVGTSCPYCNALSGKTVGIEDVFIKDQSVLYVRDDGATSWYDPETGKYSEQWGKDPGQNVKSMKFYGKRHHPPAHGGCDCVIVPVLN